MSGNVWGMIIIVNTGIIRLFITLTITFFFLNLNQNLVFAAPKDHNDHIRPVSNDVVLITFVKIQNGYSILRQINVETSVASCDLLRMQKKISNILSVFFLFFFFLFFK